MYNWVYRILSLGIHKNLLCQTMCHSPEFGTVTCLHINLCDRGILSRCWAEVHVDGWMWVGRLMHALYLFPPWVPISAMHSLFCLILPAPLWAVPRVRLCLLTSPVCFPPRSASGYKPQQYWLEVHSGQGLLPSVPQLVLTGTSWFSHQQAGLWLLHQKNNDLRRHTPPTFTNQPSCAEGNDYSSEL